ncbi:MAG: mechanosensitive ion channel family protein [Gammaproteobacteria bacterium]|nr:mechanosensitive ion channel family protein [Gammaproteobacteria bacterium]
MAGLFSFPAHGAQSPNQLDTTTAERSIDNLERMLALPNVSQESAAEAQRLGASLRGQANECVRQTESRISALRANLEVLGPQPSETDTPEIVKQRFEIQTEISLLEARNSACRLIILRSENVVAQASDLQRQLSAKRLTSQGPGGMAIFAGGPRELKEFSSSLLTQMFDRPRGAGLDGLRWVLVVLIGAFAWAAGFMLKRMVEPWCDQQRGKGGERSMKGALVRTAVRHLPVTLAGGTASIAMAVFMQNASLQLMPVRLGLAILFYGIGRTVIRWLRGNIFSPASRLLAGNQDLQLLVRSRLHALLWALLTGFVLFGTAWFGDKPNESALFVRGLVAIFLATAIIWVVRLARHIPLLKGHHKVIRFLLVSVALVGVSAELGGFRNLANYLLFGLLATLFGGLILWVILWIMRQSFAGIIGGHTQASYRIRAWLGIRADEPSAELGWLRILLGFVLWLTFGWYLLRIWDTTGNLVPLVVSYATDGIQIGEARFVPANILLGFLIFGLVVATTVWIKARLGKQWLRSAVRDRGSRDALVTITGYLGFIIAMLVGLTLAGVSFQGLALIAGALSLGIGFGLQNIVNNFVSGLILLFERPIKAGDYISVGDIEGFVKQIRIRSTELETLDNQNVIVPNSELISTQVTNWVLRDPSGRLRIQVGVAYGSDTAKVKKILEGVAREHPEVITKGRLPGPTALFMGFGDSSLDFELRAWIRNIERRYHVTSDINFSIDNAFRENGVEIPFPQRDLHVRSWSDQAAPPRERPEADDAEDSGQKGEEPDQSGGDDK